MNAPDPFVVRPATPADAEPVAALINAFDRAFLEDPDAVAAAEVAGWWSQCDLARDTALAHDPAGTLAASGLLEEEGDGVLQADVYVSPDFAGRGLGGFLLDWLEAEGAARGRPVLRTSALAADTAASGLLERRGFGQIRHFYRMLIDLDGPPAEPEWPEGFTVARFQPGEEAILHAVLEEAFAEHWGHEPRDLSSWQGRVFERDWWDPSLVFIVRDGDEPVAAALNAFRFGAGWVGTLGTLAPWRARGLGRALLLTAFAEFHRRGENRIALAVDAGNETGATHLYESVGMRIAWQADVYEKRM